MTSISGADVDVVVVVGVGVAEVVGVDGSLENLMPLEDAKLTLDWLKQKNSNFNSQENDRGGIRARGCGFEGQLFRYAPLPMRLEIS